MKKHGSKIAVIGAIILAGGVALAASGEEIATKTWSEFIQYAIQIGGPLVAAIIIGFKNPKELLSKKTTWLGISAIVGAITAWLSGSIDPPTAAYAIMAGLAAIFIRDGMISGEKKADETAAKVTELEASRARTLKRG